MLNSIISKFIYSKDLLAYSSDPKLQELKNLRSFAARVRFCKENFQKIAAGSSRIVYEYDANHVLKLAKNEKGVSQNRVENDGYTQNYYGDIITKIIDAEEDDLWIVAERAKKITPNEFKSILGFSIEDFVFYLKHRIGDNNERKYLKDEDLVQKEKMDNDPWVMEVLDMAGTVDMPTGDFGRISSYGRIENRVVLIDYGLTNDVFDTHYKRRR